MLNNFLSTETTDTLLSEPDTLAVLEFRQYAVENAVPVRLTTLKNTKDTDGNVVEVWKSHSNITDSGLDGNCRWRSSEDYLFVAIDLACGTSDDIEKISQQAYQRVLQTIKNSSHHRLLRFWNIIPRINMGDGDDENYKRFCNGRLKAFKEFGIKEEDYPAASAVGHYGDGITVYAIATKLDPMHIGNPRQVDAFEYPRQYGPSSPSFARATCLSIPDTKNQKLFFISGTASILGHDTVHINDLPGQLHTTNDNILYLLKEAGLKRDDIHSLRVYLRRPEDAALTRETVESWYPNAQVIITHADICRANLLVEIEAFCMSS
ncbi:MAG: hypothetical protein KTR16_05500 [Acidiferrobacterales bacterium]|nr:hypothetical protein [Acidiferrobacterales bacterium]